MNNIAKKMKSLVIRERSDGHLEGRFTVNGKQKSFYGKTKAEIRNKAYTYLEKIERGYADPRHIVLNDYIQYWIENFKYKTVEPSTYSRIVRTWQYHIYDDIGKMYIGRVTTKDIQLLINEKAESDDKPLAKSGLKRIYQLLNACYKQAVKEEVVQDNPCLDVSIPNDRYIKKETKTQESMTDEEIQTFKKACLEMYKTTGEYRSRDAMILLIILCLGLRVGEMLALDWSDVDFKNKVVRITKTMQCNNFDFDTGHRIQELSKNPKTRAGRRVIPMSKTVENIFVEIQEYDKRHNINTSFVCATSTNKRVDYYNLYRTLRRTVNRTDIQTHVSLHTLRHTFGSTLLRKGIQIEVVSQLMGHANISITYNKYIHVIQEQKAMAMNNVSII